MLGHIPITSAFLAQFQTPLALGLALLVRSRRAPLPAKRRAMAAGHAELERADLEDAVNDFMPSAQGLEKELQELAAVLECTQLSGRPASSWADHARACFCDHLPMPLLKEKSERDRGST